MADGDDIASTLARRAILPARPYSPTPTPAGLDPDVMEALYGTSLPSPMAPPPSLPSWIPQNVQNYMQSQPSYAEGQRQSPFPPPDIAGGEPYSPTPQIDDIKRLFTDRINRNAATSNPTSGKFLRDITLRGLLGGGNEI